MSNSARIRELINLRRFQLQDQFIKDMGFTQSLQKDYLDKDDLLRHLVNKFYLAHAQERQAREIEEAAND